MSILFFFISQLFAVSLDGIELQQVEIEDGVTVYAAENKDSRLYQAKYDTTFEGSFETALDFVVNFPKRCNNSYRKERKFLPKDFECIHHNENLIESEIVRELKVREKEENELDRFVLKRRIWNKGLHTYNDLVIVKKDQTQADEKQAVTITYRLLNDNESSNLIENPVPFNNAFYFTIGQYRIAELADSQLRVQYTYKTKTDHWFLTGSLVQGSVHSSLARGAKLAVDGIGKVLRGTK